MRWTKKLAGLRLGVLDLADVLQVIVGCLNQRALAQHQRRVGQAGRSFGKDPDIDYKWEAGKYPRVKVSD